MEKTEQHYRRKGKTKQGQPCRAAATAGGLCFFHANPDKASELGRMGGKKNRHFLPLESEALPPLDSAMAIRDTVERMINEIYSRRLHPRVAVAIGHY